MMHIHPAEAFEDQMEKMWETYQEENILYNLPYNRIKYIF